MTAKRQIEAYDRRLAKIDLGTQLTSECIGAQITIESDEYEGLITGTLIGFRHCQGVGLFGPVIHTSVEVCTGCPNRCDDEHKIATAVYRFVGIERTKEKS